MSRDFDLRHWLALTLAPSVGGESIRKLLAVFETPRAARMQSESALAKIVSAKIAQAIKAPADEQKIREALKWSEGENRKIVTLADDDYPQRLLEAKSPPLLLYARGDAALLRARSVAVVGSRNPSPAGANNAEVFARALAAEGIAVVSGLAQGIDAAAHTGALAADGRTIAVLGNGIDIAYPKENRELAAQIAARGLVVSEFALGMPPLAQNFPRRNRIISGLAIACLVVEATKNSGSLITARDAAEQGREVFATPGSINSPLYRGCHALIKQGAKLTENIRDIMDEIEGPAPDRAWPNGEDETPFAAEAEATDKVLRAIDFEPTSIDWICEQSGVAAAAALSQLTELELAGKIAALPGGKYQRLN